MKIATIQMVSATSVQANLASARALLEQAAEAGAELAVLPEYFCLLGQRDTDKLAIQEVYGAGPIQQFLADAARTLGLWVVGGTLPISCDLAPAGSPAAAPATRVFNSSLVFSAHGECVQRYDKIHLFRFDNGRERYDESKVLQRGTRPATFELPAREGHDWKSGLSVCYDLRFPQLYKQLVQQGAELLLAPSAFTHTTGSAHWEVLLRSRAIDNLAWVGAAAQGGKHSNGRRTWGHSMWVDPWGQVQAVHEEGEACVLTELSIDQLRERRQQLPLRRSPLS